MRKLSRLWQALERIPGLEAVPAEWRRHCGEDFPFIESHLKPTTHIGATFPCPHPRDADCPRRLIDYGDGSFGATCSHPHRRCDDLKVPRTEALVHVLDISSLLVPLAEALSIRLQQPTCPMPGIWGLGISVRRQYRDRPAFLLVFSRRTDLAAAVRHLTATFTSPFVAFAPTDAFATIEVREDLARHKSEFIAINDHLAIAADGRVHCVEQVAHPSTAPTAVHQRKDAVDSYRQRFGKPASFLYGAVKVHKSDFYKWMKGELPDESDKSLRIEDALRRSPEALSKPKKSM